MLQHPTSIVLAYENLVSSGHLAANVVQRAAIGRLQRVADDIARSGAGSPQRRFGWLGSKPRRMAPVRGLYLFGGVGRGKTLLMDLFAEHVHAASKRRVHFHEFMAEVHELIARFRKSHPGDPLPLVAERVASTASLLCFDELHVTDIADAMILGRLFRALFERGVTVIATSNVPPDGLYKDGLNRPLFVPFIKLIEEHMEVFALDHDQDYRREKLAGRQLYCTPLGPEARAAMDALWIEFARGHEVKATTITVLGRTIAVPASAGGVARFGFADLCEKPLGPRDYLALARHFHTLFIDDVPRLGPHDRNAARRFVNLIDTLYDAGVGLVISAEAEPDDLYPEGDGAFLFKRTASRLSEMRTQAYLDERSGRLLGR
ncbi:MAG: cell division protein ZapE [Hyphomicrobiaceae bacterium]